MYALDNVSGRWQVEVRDLLDEAFFLENILPIESGSVLAGKGRALTMPTRLPAGVWSLTAMVEDDAFILHAYVLVGDCDDTWVFNELDFDVDILEAQTVYRNSGDNDCIIFWESDNVNKDWEVSFTKLR